jgi:hypothetical protein
VGEIGIRLAHDDDWPAILELANRSLSEMPEAPSQQEWLDNRRSYSPPEGAQQHLVASLGDHLVAYACI